LEKLEILGVKAHCARTFFERARGLIARERPRPGEGMLIERCNAIHTFFMSYPIDALFLDRKGELVKRVDNIKPFTFLVWGGWRAAKVLEIPSGGEGARSEA
jgi:uncharacterized membrane protein (UPF0127 family)